MTKKYDFALISGGFDPVHIGHLAMIKDAKRIAKIIMEEMSSVSSSEQHSFSIPLTVDINIGDNWGSLH